MNLMIKSYRIFIDLLLIKATLIFIDKRHKMKKIQVKYNGIVATESRINICMIVFAFYFNQLNYTIYDTYYLQIYIC